MSRLPLDLQVYVNGALVARADARVSVFDAGFQSGDGVWEGIRVYGGRVFELDAHIERLFDSAKALGIDLHMTRDEIKDALFATLRANDLYDNAHVRLMVTRGIRRTSGINPQFVETRPTVVIIAEHKPPIFNREGITLVASSVRRPSPDTLDPKIHHANQLNSILAKMESNRIGADGAVMLDLRGFVAETDSMNLFIVKAAQLVTPLINACLHGITRGLVIQLARANGVAVLERDVSLLEVHTADEVFCTGTIAEIVPVIEVDGRTIGDGTPGPITRRVTALYADLTGRTGVPIPELASRTHERAARS